MSDGTIISQSIATPNLVQGVANSQYLLINAAQAVDVGIWIPWTPYRQGSFEVTSPTSMVGTVKLWCSNAAVMPANGYTVTVSHSAITADDTLTINLTISPYTPISYTYTVQGGDTNTTIATALTAGLVAALQTVASSGQQPLSAAAAAISVTSSLAVVTVKWTMPWLVTALTTSTSEAATEVLTTAQYDSGAGFVVPNCSVTAVGNIAFNQPAAWIKASCTAYTSGTLTAIVQATLP